MATDTAMLKDINLLVTHFEEIDATLPELRRASLDPFADPEWPRAPMLAVMRTLATKAGMPARCKAVRCRRTGCCYGQLSGEALPACAAHWSKADSARIEAAFWGVLAAWRDELDRVRHARATIAGEDEGEAPAPF